MKTKSLNYTAMMMLTKRWMRRKADAERDGCNIRLQDSIKALEQIELAVHAAPFGDESERRFDVPARICF